MVVKVFANIVIKEKVATNWPSWCFQVLTKVIRAKNTFMKKAAQRREEKEADLRAAENALTAAAVFKEKIGTKLNIL